ncbi:MAG: alpha/beta hydrolase [Saprospiraceae bacterium]|nr:alpha/beta hydrolase [Saprospiraceae bacterium]
MKKLLIPFYLLLCLPLIGQEIQKSTHLYAEKDGQNLELDIYQTANPSGKARPVLIWVHGGGFSGGQRDNKMEVRLMEAVAKEGYVGVSITYRLLRKGEATGFSCDCPRSEKIKVFKESAYDTWDAIHYIHQEKEKFQIDPEKIIVGGSSAGAEAILNAIYLKDWLFESKSKYDDIQIAGVWSQAGAIVDQRYIGAHNAVPGVFFHGTKDNLVPYATAPHHYCDPARAGYIWLDGAASIIDRLKQYGSSYLFYTYQEAKHEIAGVQFDQLPAVFRFFDAIFAGNKVVQESVIIPPK